MDEYIINQRNEDIPAKYVTAPSSDTKEPNNGYEGGTASLEHDNSNIPDKTDNKVVKDSNICINIYKNSEKIYRSDSCVEVHKANFVFRKVFSESEIDSTSARDKKKNHRLQHSKEISNPREGCYELESKNNYDNINSIDEDFSSNQSLLYYLCLKLCSFVFRHKKKQFNRNDSDLEEQAFGNNHYLDRLFLQKSNRKGHHSFFANFKERVRNITRPSSVKKKDYYNDSPLTRTFQIYFGELTAGGIEYDPESFNWIVPAVLLIVLILLVMTAAYNVFWYQSAKLDKWASSTSDPAILCAFGCIAILVIDLTFSFVVPARHPVSSWICLIVVWVCVQFIIFYIGVKVRSKETDNVLIVIVAPAVITSGVVLEFLWLSLINMDLTRSILPHVLSTISALSLLAVMTGITWGTLLYEIHELVICWIVSLYYSVSMIFLLQMILTQKTYEINEYDVALPAMLLFISPYSLITNLIRYFVFLARSDSK